MVVSGIEPSSVALHQKHAILFIKMLESNNQILNLIMPNTKWGGAEESTIV